MSDELKTALETAERRRALLALAHGELVRLSSSRDAARAGIKLVFQMIESGDLDVVHDDPVCPEDDTCTCRVRRFLLLLQAATTDPGTPEAMAAMHLIDRLPPAGPHDRADCPCGHKLGTQGPCGACNCADGTGEN